MANLPTSGILIEAESFDDYGGWLLDSQFDLIMGSPYLLAHGWGTPVKDAFSDIKILRPGQYFVWVRTKDWVPGHHPGRFLVKINGKALDTEFGTHDMEWSWQYGGKVQLESHLRLALHDLTGFDGRCDAIFFSQEDTPPPETVDEASRAWRRKFRGLSPEPVAGGSFDVIVVGGGFVGAAATLTAARLGDRVALVHDRPVLGGNSSTEIGLSPRGEHGPLVKEINQRQADGNIFAEQLIRAEPTATMFLDQTVYYTVIQDSKIMAIDIRDARTGYESRISAPVFIDCSGKAILGMLAGAETMFGQEARGRYDESLAPTVATNMHHGNTLFFRTKMSDSPVHFPSVPWATEISKDYADLGGQLITPGYENGPGPKTQSAAQAQANIRRRMRLPLTHYWEYGQWLDPYTQAENIRDHLLRAVYGTFSNVKTGEPDKFANLAFEWLAFVPGQGEFRRYRGPYVLTENDIRSHRTFEDAVVQNGSAFCLHYPGDQKYDFRLKDWIWDERDGLPFDIPFRCLHSVNIANLMMAGKHISVSHVASSCTKFMGNGAQHAIATGAAAHICKSHSVLPAEVQGSHLQELKSLIAGFIPANKPLSRL